MGDGSLPAWLAHTGSSSNLATGEQPSVHRYIPHWRMHVENYRRKTASERRSGSGRPPARTTITENSRLSRHTGKHSRPICRASAWSFPPRLCCGGARLSRLGESVDPPAVEGGADGEILLPGLRDHRPDTGPVPCHLVRLGEAELPGDAVVREIGWRQPFSR